MYRYLCGIAEAVLQRCSVKKMFLKIFQNYRKTPALKSFLVKLQAREQHLYEIETPAQVFSSEFERVFRKPILYNI